MMLFKKIGDMIMLPGSPSDDPLSGDAGDITNMDIIYVDDMANFRGI